MKKIIWILIAILAVTVIYIGYGVSKVKGYEEQKAEWKNVLEQNRESFEYVVQNLNYEEVSYVELYDEIKIAYTNNNTTNEISDNSLLIALNEIKKCGIDIVIRYDAKGGWSFIKEEKDANKPHLHEIGLIYSKNREDGIQHIKGNWFFRNTKYDTQNESALFRTIYYNLYE